MTLASRIFRSPFTDKWYFWDDAWANAAGPFDEYIEAHAALTKYMEEHDGSQKQGPCG